jgi:hypothetical protein
MIPHSKTLIRKDSVFFRVFSILFLILAISLSTGNVFAQRISSVEEEIEGELEILHEDRDVGSRYLYFLKAAGRRLSLNFAKDAPTHLTSGARVRVRGVRTNGVLALQSGGSDSVQVLSSALPNTLGEQRTLVILVNFRNNTSQPYTTDFANNALFGTTSNFFLENSYQQTYLSGVIMGWYTIDMDSPTSASTCDYSLISSLADQFASNAGAVLSNYSHKVYAFPSAGCGWWGLSSVGGNPSRAWINGSLELGVTAHELGHGLGLWHSHALNCGNVTLGPNCSAIEYGDIFDTMSASNLYGSFNAFQKERLGWLNFGASPPITTALTDGTYLLENYEIVGAGPKALKVLKSTDPITGQRTWYYIESRQAIGFDAFLANNTNVLNGVLVRLGSESDGDSSYLLDLNPGDDSVIWDWLVNAPLVTGQSYQDSGSGVTLTTEWVTGSHAAVTVRFSYTVTVATDKPSYNRGQTVSIIVKISSAGSPIANVQMNFSVTKSSGEVVTASAITGSNGTAAYKFRLRKQDPIGTYRVNVFATKNGLSGQGSASFIVQ